MFEQLYKVVDDIEYIKLLSIFRLPLSRLENYSIRLFFLIEYFKVLTKFIDFQMVSKSISFTFCLIKSWSHDQSECTNIFHS